MLAEEFGIGGYSHTFSDGVQGWVDFNGKGLRLRTGEIQLESFLGEGRRPDQNAHP